MQFGTARNPADLKSAADMPSNLDGPVAAGFLGDAGLALVQQVQRRLDGVAGGALGLGGDGVAAVPGGLDGGLQVCGHGEIPVC